MIFCPPLYLPKVVPIETNLDNFFLSGLSFHLTSLHFNLLLTCFCYPSPCISTHSTTSVDEELDMEGAYYLHYRHS